MRRKRSSSASAYENKHNKDVIMSWTRHANAVLFQCFLNAITSANCSLLVSVFVSSARHSVATLNARLQRRYTAVTQTQLFPFIAARKGSEFNHNKDAPIWVSLLSLICFTLEFILLQFMITRTVGRNNIQSSANFRFNCPHQSSLNGHNRVCGVTTWNIFSDVCSIVLEKRF